LLDDPLPTTYCINHPGRETVLRCNRCDQPICLDCAVHTPVGYRCKTCVRSQQAVHFNARPAEPVLAAAVAFVLAAVVGAIVVSIVGMLGFFRLIVLILLGPAVGGLIAEAARRATGRRRARHMNLVVAGASVLGVLVGVAAWPVIMAGAPASSIPAYLILRWDALVFAALMGSAVYARLQ